MVRAAIVGTGACLPPFEATNEDIASFFPSPRGEAWTPPWVERRLGIRTRRSTFDFVGGKLRTGYYDGDMAYGAARAAIEDAGISPSDIGQVIYATSTPEQLMPDPACVLHGRLGLALDASAIGLTAVGCGGFVYALDLADSAIRAGKCRTVLAVGTISVGPYIDAIATSADPAERERLLSLNLPNAYIFGEGAGAMILRATDAATGILGTYAGACHTANPVTVTAGGSRMPATHDTVSQGLHRFAMDARLVRREGPKHFQRAIAAVLRRANLGLAVIDHFVFHQVNARLLRELASSLEIPWEKLVVHVDHYGNLDTATLPVALHEARTTGRIRPGDLVLFAAIGAGWQFGAAIARL